MLVAGLYASHDTSFCILEDGQPILHVELERYIRQKQPKGDPFQLLMNDFKDFKNIKHFVEIVDTKHMTVKQFPYAYKMIQDIIKKNDGKHMVVGHHQAHAANAFYSSNFDDSLILTIDGGGLDVVNGENKVSTFTIWEGKDKKINPIAYFTEDMFNIGSTWNIFTTRVFNLSGGWPKGDQAGSVMAMACMGDSKKYESHLKNINFCHHSYWDNSKANSFLQLVEAASKGEEEQFNVAAALQAATEELVFAIIDKYLKKTKKRNICLAGGVALNSVMVGKLHDVFKTRIDNVYVCPVPYDAGLPIGSCQYAWHHILEKDRINWCDNATPYLGIQYEEKDVHSCLSRYDNLLEVKKGFTTREMCQLLSTGKIISLFSGRSESGRRALGNRSILADPRNPDMKDIINKKVKHRQWYRPFAPSILKEHVAEWFEHDIDSPYMTTVLKFKKTHADKVPAVNHFDNSARLQTVTEKDNKVYYNLIKTWYEVSGVPIILNTSFNDREPIVETPEDAVKCFLNTDIDNLYFPEYGILVSKK